MYLISTQDNFVIFLDERREIGDENWPMVDMIRFYCFIN